MSSPVLAHSTPQRPVGLILAAIVLALMTCYGLLSSATIIFTALAIHTPQTAQYPMIKAVQVAMGVMSLLISGFCAATVVGLFQVQRWARYGILIFGGLLAIFSALFAILCTAFAFSSLLAKTSPPNAPAVNPATMKFIFLGMGGFFLLVSLIGVWWLVYFNLRRVRALFKPKRYPMTGEHLSTAPDAELQLPVASTSTNTSVIEVLVACLAVLYLFGAASAVGMALLHFPLFFLGFIARGPAASAFSLALAALSVAIGIGLLRRRKAGWILAFAFQIVGAISSLLLLLPGNRATLARYQQEISQHMSSRFGLPAPTPNPAFQGTTMYALSGIVGVVIAAAVIWLLIQARPYFGIRPNA
jgi:hypothetical protein